MNMARIQACAQSLDSSKTLFPSLGLTLVDSCSYMKTRYNNEIKFEILITPSGGP